MTISGNRNTATITQERARAGGHEPFVVWGQLVTDDEEWAAGRVLAKQADGKWLPYDTAEAVAVGTGDGAEDTFALALGPGVVPGTVTVTDETETFSDGGNGVLTGDAETPGSGVIDYATGIGSVTFAAAPANAQAVTGTAKHNPAGVLDEKTDTENESAALVIVHGTVKLSMLCTDAAGETPATAAILAQLHAAGIWAV